MSDLFAELVVRDVAEIRRRRPLVHNITNFVVMNETANVLLAAGASPVMAHALEEAADMVAIADALVLNMGTLWPDQVSSMIEAGRAANSKGIPVVFDPVGAGATAFRTSSARRILEAVNVSMVRCNAGEAMALSGTGGLVRGVDSATDSGSFAERAAEIARIVGCPVAVTGATDVITDGEKILLCDNGHPMLQTVTGTGCSVSALTGAFMAVDSDPVSAAAAALAWFGVCGELAARTSSGPGSFETALRDALYSAMPATVAEMVRLRIA